MRRPPLIVLLVAAAAALAACTGPCEELGVKLCDCAPAGQTKESCQQNVQDELDRADPSSADENRCEDLLDTCNSPSGVTFCEWLASEDGKVGCGIAFPSPTP